MNTEISKRKQLLNKAFRELRKRGIIARQNFWCCQSCGWAAMEEEEKKYISRNGMKPRGYVFYHGQDNDGLLAGDGLYIAFDGELPVTQEEIGKEAAEVFRSTGLSVEWDGDIHSRIFINPLKVEE